MIHKILLLIRSLLNLLFTLRRSPGRIDQITVATDVIVRWPKPGSPRFLFAHRATPLLWRDSDARFSGHSIDWEARELATSIASRGFEIVAVSGWSAAPDLLSPGSEFAGILDENANLLRYNHLLQPQALRLLYLTGSYARFMNEAEWERCLQLRERRGVSYYPKRQVREYLFDAALELCDGALLVGNENTLATYPAPMRAKIRRTTVSSSRYIPKTLKALAPRQREFLWFFGEGAVHKGLDLVLDAFVRRSEVQLNVVGPVLRDRDFCEIYRKELFETQNISFHGFLHPTSAPFLALQNRCFAFIAPSCSEGISPAAATCMAAGLFPIVSRQTGIDLPGNCGLFIESLTVEAIVEAVDKALSISDSELNQHLSVSMDYAQRKYSRSEYSAQLQAFFDEFLKSPNLD